MGKKKTKKEIIAKIRVLVPIITIVMIIFIVVVDQVGDSAIHREWNKSIEVFLQYPQLIAKHKEVFSGATVFRGQQRVFAHGAPVGAPITVGPTPQGYTISVWLDRDSGWHTASKVMALLTVVLLVGNIFLQMYSPTSDSGVEEEEDEEDEITGDIPKDIMKEIPKEEDRDLGDEIKELIEISESVGR